MTVRALVEQACTFLSNGLDFAAVVLLEGAVEIPTGCEPVSDPADLLERLDVEVAPLQDSALAITQHARWVKTLVDVLQAQIDRARLDTTPPVAVVDAPLVTVQIPVDGRSDSLLDRAIPSVLAGAYPHLEILVCGAGLPGDARAAVEAIDDPRVRYVDLGEPLGYPSRPLAREQMARAVAVNRLMEETRGTCIAPLDHDAAFTIDHVLVLLDALRRSGGDVAYGTALSESADGGWRVLGMGGPAIRSSTGLSCTQAVCLICAVTLTRGCSRSRLTGTGGGGCVTPERGSTKCWRPSLSSSRPRVRPSPGDGTRPCSTNRRRPTYSPTSARELLLVSSRREARGGYRSGPRRGARWPRRFLRAAGVAGHPLSVWLSGFRWHEAKAMLESSGHGLLFASRDRRELARHRAPARGVPGSRC